MNAQSKIEAPPNVYKCIAAVQAELAKVGIAKGRKNMTPGQNYNFRGIDEVYNVLSPLLDEHGLCVLPRILTRGVTTRPTKSGGTLFCVTVEAEFDFVSACDGSIHTIRTFGEAMDSSDKATNKAMSAAYKYAALMTFAIPTEGDNDADATTHEVALTGEEMPDAEWAKLVQLIEVTGADRGKMLKLYGVSNLRMLDKDQYAEAVDLLNKKLADKAKAETDAKAKEAVDA